jgi:hypothetical protein
MLKALGTQRFQALSSDLGRSLSFLLFCDCQARGRRFETDHCSLKTPRKLQSNYHYFLENRADLRSRRDTAKSAMLPRFRCIILPRYEGIGVALRYAHCGLGFV